MPLPRFTFNNLPARASSRSGERYRVSTDTQFPASSTPYHLCEPSAAYPPTCPPASYNAPAHNPRDVPHSQSYRVYGRVTITPHAEDNPPFHLGQLSINPAQARAECGGPRAPEGFVSSPAYVSSQRGASNANRSYEPVLHRSNSSSLRYPYTISVPSSERGGMSRRSRASEYSMPSAGSSRPLYSF